MSERSVMSDELKAMSALDRALQKIEKAGDSAKVLLMFAKSRLEQIEAKLGK